MTEETDHQPELLHVLGDEAEEPSVQDEIALFTGGRHARYTRFVMAVLGSIPWVGSVISASASFHAEAEQARVNELHQSWIDEHRQRLNELARTLAEMMARLDELGPTAAERVQSDEYLHLVRQGFRTWDEAATTEKRKLVQQLLSNAGGISITSDDVVRLFLGWIERYHETHFAVIREIHQSPGVTRAEIWTVIRGTRPREDSAEADLFKLLIRDLSTGSVIRQRRETNHLGEYIKRKPRRRKGSGGSVMKSAFDDIEPYELTKLGQQFVHYAMTELVRRVGT